MIKLKIKSSNDIVLNITVINELRRNMNRAKYAVQWLTLSQVPLTGYIPLRRGQWEVGRAFSEITSNHKQVLRLGQDAKTGHNFLRKHI